MGRMHTLVRGSLLVVAAIIATAALAEDAKVATAAIPPPAKAAEPSPIDNATLYCRNISNAAADARYARQTDSLAAMSKELSDRIDALEKKRAEYESWVK